MYDFVNAFDTGAAIALGVSHDLRGVLPIGSGRLRGVRDIDQAIGAPCVPADVSGQRGMSHGFPTSEIDGLGGISGEPSATAAVFREVDS